MGEGESERVAEHEFEMVGVVVNVGVEKEEGVVVDVGVDVFCGESEGVMDGVYPLLFDLSFSPLPIS